MDLFSFIKKIYLIVLVLALSLAFRVTNLDLIEFKADEGINLFLATRPLFGHEFVPGGTISSIGITNFPLLNYILLPFAILSQDPKTISFLIGLLNSFSVIAFFVITRKYYNQTVALVSSVLMATSPWAILFSRKIWAQDFIFPLFIPFFLSIHKIIVDRNQKYWALFTFSSLILIQIHQSALFFILPLTIFMLFYKTKLDFKFTVIGFVLGALPSLHYFYYQIMSRCFDCRMLLTSGQRVTMDPSPLLFLRPLQLVNQGNFSPILGEHIAYFANNFPFAYFLKQFFYIEYILIPIGGFIFFKIYKNLKPIPLAVVLLPFIYAFFKLEAHIHYYLIIAPFLFLFLGSSLDFLIRNRSKVVSLSGFLIFGTLVIVSLYYNYAFYKTIDQLEDIKGDYGTVFRIKERETIERYQAFESEPGYDEMIIASYVPYELSRGNIGISRMLFNENEVRNNLPKLEERLKVAEHDKRAQQQLIYYYTRTVPSKKTVKELRKKALLIPGYEAVYDEAREYYNENHRDKPI